MQNELFKEQNLDNENKPNTILYDKSKYLFRLDRDYNFNKNDYQFDVNEKNSFDNNIEDDKTFSKINIVELLNNDNIINQEANENIVNSDELYINKEDSLETINANDNALENSIYVAEPVSNVEIVKPMDNIEEKVSNVSVYADDFAKIASEKEYVYSKDTSIINQEEQLIDANETVNNIDMNLTDNLNKQDALVNSLEKSASTENLTINEVEQNNNIQEINLADADTSFNSDTMIYPNITKDVLVDNNVSLVLQEPPKLEEVNESSNQNNVVFESQKDEDIEIFDVNE